MQKFLECLYFSVVVSMAPCVFECEIDHKCVKSSGRRNKKICILYTRFRESKTHCSDSDEGIDHWRHRKMRAYESRRMKL